MNDDAAWGAVSDQVVLNFAAAVALIMVIISEDMVDLGRSASDAHDNGAMAADGMNAIDEALIEASEPFLSFIDFARTLTTVAALRSSWTTLPVRVRGVVTTLASFMETTCSATLGNEDHFGALRTQLDAVTANITNPIASAFVRLSTFRVVAECAAKRTAWKLLEPQWCKRRDRAFAKISRDIENLRSIALDSPWSQDGKSAGYARVEALLTDFRHQLDAFTRPMVERDGRLVINPLAASRRDIGATPPSDRGGRPRETWRTEAILGLREIGYTVEDAEALLDAAGLTAPYSGRRSS